MTVSPRSFIKIKAVTQRIVVEFPNSGSWTSFVLVEPPYKRLPFRSCHQLRPLSNLLPPSGPPRLFVNCSRWRGRVGIIVRRDSLPPDWSDGGATRHPKAAASVLEVVDVIFDAAHRFLRRFLWRHCVWEMKKRSCYELRERERMWREIQSHSLAFSEKRKKMRNFSLFQ